MWWIFGAAIVLGAAVAQIRSAVILVAGAALAFGVAGVFALLHGSGVWLAFGAAFGDVVAYEAAFALAAVWMERAGAVKRARAGVHPGLRDALHH